MAASYPVMAASQPDHTSAIQDFIKWTHSQDAQREGCCGSDNTTVSRYIPQVALEGKLTKRTIEALLNELFQGSDQPTPSAENIRVYHLRCFAILLLAGSGLMIRHFLQYRSLQDAALPFSSEPKDFPKSTSRDLFHEFYDKQWQFCAVRFEYDVNYQVADDDILPITRGRQIGEGGSANLYKICIDPGYNGLLQSEPTHTARTKPNPNVFALKTYRTPDARLYFETERNALIRLRYGGLPHPNIIAFYGSFVRNNTYNIILEYADRRTLDHYMATTHEPTSPNNILHFWRQFLAILQGLVQIHGTRADDSDELQKLLGWHQDISPDNILVVSRGLDNPYDCDFKLADFGLAHFKRHTSSSHDATDEDRYTTNSYGAPETHRNANLERSHLRVTQSVDIWSMGCVFSEVGTWVAEGTQKLQEYRRRRKLEILEKSRTDAGEALFHHESKVLDAVQQIHEDIVQNTRPSDHVTPSVVQKLIEAMMMADPGSRPSAKFFLTQSITILEKAQSKLANRSSRGPIPNSDHTTSGEAVALRKPRLPPNFPPGRLRLGASESFESNKDASSSEHTPRTRPSSSTYAPEGSNPASPQRSADRRSSQTPNKQHDEGNGAGISLDYHNDLYHEPHSYARPPQRVLPYPTLPSRYSQSHTQSAVNRGVKAHPSLQENAIEISTSMLNNDHSPNFSNSLPLQGHRLAHTASGHAIQRPYQTNWTHEALSHGEPDPFAPSRAASIRSPPVPPKSQPKPSPQPKAGQTERPHPEMSVEAGLDVKRKKDKARNASYPGRYDLYQTLDAILSKRDHAFLVDNAASMSPHWEKVRKVLELLWALTELYDPDGLDLYLSTENKKHKPKTNRRMLRLFDDCSTQGCPDMRQRFASIIESYQSRLGKKNTFSKIWHPNSTPDIGPRALTLYVLTDGVWQPNCTLETEIKNLVTSLRQHGMPNKHIGIQFIRFGDNEEGTRRLQHLDSGLGLELDIIDTTPADGNVWKMLLGAVNDWFDDDHDRYTNGDNRP